MHHHVLEALKEAGVIQDYWYESPTGLVVIPVKAIDFIKLNIVKERREIVSEELLFENPEFQFGINFTVRHGTKWADLVNVGDVVKLRNLGGNEVKVKGQIFQSVLGEITHVFKCKLQDLPQMVFDHGHDPGCRTIAGLIDMLKEVYPVLREIATHASVGEEVVTALGFKVYAQIPQI